MVIISNPQTDGQSSQTHAAQQQPLEGGPEGLNDVDEPPIPDPGLPGNGTDVQQQHHHRGKRANVKESLEIVKNVDTLDSDTAITIAGWDGDADFAHLFGKDELAAFLGTDVA